MHSLFQPTPPAASVIEPVPTVFPKVEGAEIAAVFVGKRIAGDFYDSIRVGTERVLFGILDIAGQRHENRDLLVKVQQIFRTAGAQLFSAPDLNESEAMTAFSVDLNRGLIDFSGKVHSCPAFIACYHERFGTLCYTNAGHTPGLLCDASGISELRSTGLPLGLFSHVTHEAPTVAVEKNAALVLVSRGLVECEAQGGEPEQEFGLERVKQLLSEGPVKSALDLCTSILGAADAFCATTAMHNDRTAMALIRSK